MEHLVINGENYKMKWSWTYSINMDGTMFKMYLNDKFQDICPIIYFNQFYTSHINLHSNLPGYSDCLKIARDELLERGLIDE